MIKKIFEIEAYIFFVIVDILLIYNIIKNQPQQFIMCAFLLIFQGIKSFISIKKGK